METFTSDNPWWDIAKVAEAVLVSQSSLPLEEALRGWLNTNRPWRIERGADPQWTFGWRVVPEEVSFSFSEGDFNHGSPPSALMERWAKCLPLFAEIIKRNPCLTGRATVNWGDSAWRQGLGFCARQPNVTLVPDIDFIGSLGYRDYKISVASLPSWEQRRSVALWRGTLWGGILPGGWRAQLRTRLCEMACDLLDAGATGCPSADREAIALAGLLRPPIDGVGMAMFKCHVDIDGYSNAWSGLFRKLCTGGVVLKVGSEFHQWYYNRLIPWANYIPVSPDLSDLLQNISWVVTHDNEAREIGAAGQRLANAMSYEAELELIEPAIVAALQGGNQEKPA